MFAACFCAVHTHQLGFANTSLPTLVCRVKAALLGLGTEQVEPSCKHDFACQASHFKHFGEFPRPKKYSVCIVFVTMLFPVCIVVFPAEIFLGAVQLQLCIY